MIVTNALWRLKGLKRNIIADTSMLISHKQLKLSRELII